MLNLSEQNLNKSAIFGNNKSIINNQFQNMSSFFDTSGNTEDNSID